MKRAASLHVWVVLGVRRDQKNLALFSVLVDWQGKSHLIPLGLSFSRRLI